MTKKSKKPSWIEWLQRKILSTKEQEDLFEYVLSQKEKTLHGETSHKQKSHTEEKESKKRSLFLLWRWVAVGLCCFLSAYVGSIVLQKNDSFCKIGREAIVYRFGQSTKKGRIQGISNGKVKLVQSKEKQLFAGNSFYIHLDDIRRIDLKPLEKEKKDKSQNDRNLSLARRKFLGRYRLRVSMHRGLFYIYRRKNGKLGASLRFTNWGNQVMEFLYAVRVQGSQIQFRRSCKGRRCREIGTNRIMRQDFKGTISKDLRTIQGAYTGNQSSGKWTAKRY